MHLYDGFARAITDGAVPYRDFFLEYPPGALAVFLPPRLAGDHYIGAFKLLMAACGVATLALVVLLLRRINASRKHVAAAALLLGLSPLAYGPINLNTYDAFPALLTVGALAALAWRRDLLALGLLGFAFSAKIYPLVLVPVALLYVGRARGRRRALAAGGAFAAVAALVLVPFAAAAPEGLWESFRAQSARGLQIESLGAQILIAADHVGVYSATVVHRTERAVGYDLVGTLPDALAVASTVLQLSAVAAAAATYRRHRDRPVAAAAAAVTGFLAFSRFISPQYLIWVLPLAAGVARPLVWLVVGVAPDLAQTWFFHYRALVELGQRNWLVFLRDLLLVLAFALLLRHAAKDQDAVALEHEPPLGIRP